jgi:RNA polymerase sigma-70 factor (ECF subfamily)
MRLAPAGFGRWTEPSQAAIPPVDEETVRAIKLGSVAAWEVAYRVYGRPMMGFLMTQLRDRDDASEALSETYLRALEKIGGFRGGAFSFRAWLYRIARNVASDRRRMRSRLVPGITEGDLVDRSQLSCDEWVIGHEDGEAVRRAFAGLNNEDRELLWLRVCEGMDSAEVGRIIGKRPGTVRMQQLRALELMARRMAE